MTTRAFVGLALPENVKTSLSALQTGPRTARWVNPNNFHITLIFAGDLDVRQITDIDSTLSSLSQTSFSLVLSGSGFFGKKQPNSLWVGVAQNDPLSLLQSKIQTAVRRIPIDVQTRKYVPHVTLAYLKRAQREDAEQWCLINAMATVGPIPISEFHLYASHLGKEGSHYEILRSYELL
ncbi:MAG: RNA 2',3'-cyclic phosphodiesterase [Pseudomonadota bacterium]